MNVVALIPIYFTRPCLSLLTGSVGEFKITGLVSPWWDTHAADNVLPANVFVSITLQRLMRCSEAQIAG